MNPDSYPLDKVLNMEEVLTFYLNMFSDKIVANLIDLHHYERIKAENPGYVTTNGAGQRVTVDQLIVGNRNGIRYARENVAKIMQFLELAKAGTLASEITDEAIGHHLSPLQAKDGKVEEAKPGEDEGKK